MYYAYDPVGNITQIINDTTTPSGHNHVFTYDPLNRLTTLSEGTNWLQESGGHVVAAAPGDTLQSYAYNTIGNITNKSDIGDYTYAGTGYANPHAPTTINGVTHTYDNNGNLTSDGTWTHTWDYRNRLASSGNGVATTTYSYDEKGERARMDDGTTVFHYANDLFQTDDSPSIPTKHIFLPSGQLIATVKGSDEDATLSYVHADHLGSTQAVTANGGTREQFLDYWPYGQTRVSEQYTADNEKRQFIGEVFDGETGLSYLNARYYNSAQGQFLSEDPVFLGDPKSQVLTDPQSLNSYSYANDNPVVKSDPSGRCAGPLLIVCIGIIGAGISSYATYADDVLNNRASPNPNLNPYLDNLSTPTTYATGDLTGGFSLAFLPENRAVSAGLAFTSSLGQNYTNNRPLDLPNAGIAGIMTAVSGGFFNSSVSRVTARSIQATVGREVFQNASVLVAQNALRINTGANAGKTTQTQMQSAIPASTNTRSLMAKLFPSTIK
jgi:RHS repeat-associated protein